MANDVYCRDTSGPLEADVIVSFETSDLLSMCSTLDAAECELGATEARALLAVISEMEALDIAYEFLEQAMDDATITVDNMIEVAVGTEHRATFVPVGVRYQTHPDGTIDWSTVKRLKLTSVFRCS